MRGKVLGIRSIIDRYKIGDIKNSIGNGEVKELICTTHGCELRGGGGGVGWRGTQWREKMGQLQ